MVGPTEWSFSSTVDSSEGLKRQESLVSLERLPLARSPNLTALTVAYLFRMGQWSDNEQVGGDAKGRSMSSLRTMRPLLLRPSPSGQSTVTLNEGQGCPRLLMNSVQS